jgi:hypothetical protein
VREATLETAPYGRHVPSDGWFVLDLGNTPAVRNEQDVGGDVADAERPGDSEPVRLHRPPR